MRSCEENFGEKLTQVVQRTRTGVGREIGRVGNV